MASSIDFGTITLSGGTTRLSGTSSNLDTEALIQALADAKRLPAVRLENRISDNEAKLAAYEELRGLLSDFRDAVAGLRNPPGFFGVNDNLFEKKDVFFSSDTTTSPAELLAVSAANTAQPGSFTLTVDRLAAAHKFSSDSAGGASQSLADAFNGGTAFSGSFTIGLAGSGTTATVTVDGTMDIYDLETAINATTSDSGVSASVLKVSDTDYRLVLTATETGKSVQLSPAGGDNVLDIVGLTTGGGSAIKNEIQAAQTARITLDGVTIERSSNTIDDVLEGVTLNLFKADSTTTVTVDVQRSAASVKDAILEFVDSYNALRDFAAAQVEVGEDGSVDEDAVLFGDGTLRSIVAGVSSAISSQVEGLPATALASLAELGITLDSDNKLVVDQAKLDEKLVSDLGGVRRVFEFTFQASSSELAVYSRSNALSDTSFTVNIVDADGDGVIESADIDGVAVDVSGGRITGRDGTPYEGLVLLWSGSGSTSITATATQGIADRLYNTLDAAIDGIDGTLTNTIDAVEQENARLADEIAKIDARVETFRQYLIEKFAALEAALTVANNMLQQVEATTAAMFGKDR